MPQHAHVRGKCSVSWFRPLKIGDFLIPFNKRKIQQRCGDAAKLIFKKMPWSKHVTVYVVWSSIRNFFSACKSIWKWIADHPKTGFIQSKRPCTVNDMIYIYNSTYTRTRICLYHTYVLKLSIVSLCTHMHASYHGVWSRPAARLAVCSATPGTRLLLLLPLTVADALSTTSLW